MCLDWPQKEKHGSSSIAQSQPKKNKKAWKAHEQCPYKANKQKWNPVLQFHLFCSPPVYPEYRTLDHSESVRVASKPPLVLNGDRLFWALQRQRGKSDSYVQITGVLNLLFKCKYWKRGCFEAKTCPKPVSYKPGSLYLKTFSKVSSLLCLHFLNYDTGLILKSKLYSLTAACNFLVFSFFFLVFPYFEVFRQNCESLQHQAK